MRWAEYGTVLSFHTFDVFYTGRGAGFALCGSEGGQQGGSDGGALLASCKDVPSEAQNN